MTSALFFFVFATLALQIAAFPQASRNLARQAGPDSWSPAAAGDVRSPCPGLNTLANHGFINHNGRGITKQQMQQGFLDAFGLGTFLFSFVHFSTFADPRSSLRDHGRWWHECS